MSGAGRRGLTPENRVLVEAGRERTSAQTRVLRHCRGLIGAAAGEPYRVPDMYWSLLAKLVEAERAAEEAYQAALGAVAEAENDALMAHARGADSLPDRAREIVVTIAGPANSGKSRLAARVTEIFKEIGVTATVLEENTPKPPVQP